MHLSRFRVRGYELDSFGHVNHAVYLNYCEHARWEFLRQEGIFLTSFQQWKRWPVIAGIEIKYLRPAFMHDELEVRTRVTEHAGASFSLEQEIHRVEPNPTPIVRALVRSVMVDERGKPAPLAPELANLWGERDGD